MGIMTPVIGFDVVSSWEWSPVWLYKSYVARAKYAFFLTNNATIRPDLHEISALHTTLGAIQVLITSAHEMQTRYIITGFGIGCATIWVAAKNFTLLVESFNSGDNQVESNSSAEKRAVLLIDNFHQLKKLARCVNKVWQFISFWFMLDVTVWLATDLDRALRTNDWFIKAHLFYFLVYSGASLTLSAESSRKVC